MLFCCFIPSLSVPNGVGYNLRTNKGRAIHIYKLHFLRPTETASLFIRSRSKCSRRKRKYDFEYCCSIQKVNSGSSESFEAGDGNTVFLIDALALIYRSHFALARSGLRTSYGLETGPIYGFISTFVSLLETYKASCAMVVFDSYYFPPYVSSESTPWQRRALYPDYKKNRSKMPTAIEKSLPYIKALVSALGISIVEVASTEADDVIGSLVKYCSSNSFSSNIVSADKDFLQLLDESYCSILRPRTTNKTTKGGSAIQKDGGNLPSWTLITESDFRNTFDNLSPLQYCDVLALVGDPVDNIPGVAGIGEKQAVALVKNFGSIESLVENWKVISSPRLREKIFHHRELLLLSKTLVTIHQDLNIPNFDISDVFIRPPQLEKINYIMDKLEFKKLKERVDRYVKSSCSSELSPIKRNWSYSHVENARSENGQHKGGVEQCCDRIDKFRKLGIQCLFLSTLVNYDVAEDKWEQLLSSVRTQSTEVPFITFWTDYDVDPAERGKHKKRVLLDDSNSGTILENKWKIPDNDNFPFQDVVVIRGIVISWEGSSSVYLDLENTKVVWVQQLEWLLCHSPISKVSIFVKKQIHALQRWNRNCSLKFPFVDILIGHHAAAPFESLSVSQVMKRYAMLSGDLDTLAMTELMFSTMDEEALHEFRREALKLISCQVEVLSSSFVDLFRVWFQCHWAVLLFRATKFLNAELAMLSMKSFVEYIEYPLIQVLATMEANGLYVNMEKLVEMNHKERRRSQSSKEKLQKVTQSFQDNVTTYDSDTLATEMWNIECKKYESSSIAIGKFVRKRITVYNM